MRRIAMVMHWSIIVDKLEMERCMAMDDMARRGW
jgi:hypothetical protein